MMTRLRGALVLTAVFAPAAFADTPPCAPNPDPSANTTACPVPKDGTTTTTTTTQTNPATPSPTPPTTTTNDESGTPPTVVTEPEATVPPPPYEAPPTYQANDRTYTTTTTETQQSFFTRYGIALSAGGGVSDFTDKTARSETKAGGSWDVRAILGSKSPLAAEVSYLGSAQEITSLGLSNNALLVGNGAQGDLRVNFTPHYMVTPFIYGGVAWRHYSIERSDVNTSDVANTDNVMEFPVGAGVAYHYNGLMLDARGEYRRTTSNDLMPSLSNSGDNASLHRWGVNANIGFEF